MQIGDQFRFDPKLFSIESPNYRDIMRSASSVAEVTMADNQLVVGVDKDNEIVSADYCDGTRLIRNPDWRGGHIVLVESPDGSYWYMNSPDCWMRLD